MPHLYGVLRYACVLPADPRNFATIFLPSLLTRTTLQPSSNAALALQIGDVQFWKLAKEEQNQKYSFVFALQLDGKDQHSTCPAGHPCTHAHTFASVPASRRLSPVLFCPMRLP